VFGYDTSGFHRCATFTNCVNPTTYDAGDPNVYQRKEATGAGSASGSGTGAGGSAGAAGGSGAVAGGSAGVAGASGASGGYALPKWSYSGCEEIPVDLDDYVTKNSKFSASMSLGLCYQHCKDAPGMKYFSITKGNTCFCSPIVPGSALDSERCGKTCPGEVGTKCGGIARAASVYVIIDPPATAHEIQAQEHHEKMKSIYSYSKFAGESCSMDRGNRVEVDGSPEFTGTVDDCKLLCSTKPGSDSCHGFTYDSDQSKCMFYQDVVAGGTGDIKKKQSFACYWKKTGGSRLKGFDEFPLA
jgi:hypothetical protein